LLLLIENLKTVIGWQVFLSVESFRANLTSKKERADMLSEKQKKFDEQKWLESEKLGVDTCGTYKFCGKCDKTIENHCAVAKAKHSKKKSK
jgi:predicted PP-loop superfamily ATPase